MPWNPDRSWADPLILLLALLALFAAGLTLGGRRRSALRPAQQASLQVRLLEVGLAGPRLLTGQGRSAHDWDQATAQAKAPWDRALLAVLKGELQAAPGTIPPLPQVPVPEGPGGDSFHQVCRAAYAEGPLPTAGERADVHRRLGNGYSADLLEARIQDREGGGAALRAQARSALLRRLLGLAILGFVVLAAAAGGLAVGIYLLVTWRDPRPHPLPTWTLSGRAAALVFLLWFLAFFLAGNVAGILLLPWPTLHWLALPLGYGLHALVGCWLICRAEGLTVAELWHKVAPGRVGRDLAWAGAFLALALCLVLAVAVVSNVLLKPDQSPQRDLQDLLRSLSGWAPNLALFLTVGGVAPWFEELLFRGFLLPVMARQGRLVPALLLSSLLFGAIHLQPMGLPVLSTLGLVLGLALRQSGSLRTPILVHACWNGSMFLFLRAFA